MAPQTTPQRLREIIDLLGKATTFVQQKAVRDTLAADELLDYEAWTQNLPGAVQPAPEHVTLTIPAPPQKQPGVKPTLTIAITPYPKWWKELRVAPINISGPATVDIISGSSSFSIYVATIVLSVNGETEVRFTFGMFGQGGSIFLGGENQPMGMVIAMGGSPAPCGQGAFSIYSSGSGISVGGFVAYYVEKDIIQKTQATKT